jgi:hypothetical protein
MPTTKSNQLDMWQMLMHCGIKMNLARINAESVKAKYDRNRLVYSYFMGRSLAATEGKRMVATITRNIKTAGYAFDQYFLLFHGQKPSPDANDLGDKVKEGLNAYGYAATV